ncbi:SGNH/GDSL hydrolase family protein [uncultured Bacteroides sp.]|uniref:SGNH/GDSL hydrolase family protein n=1 Tax=uncultured Bacteroides sp. TaxID=162156 RepID=UPI00260ABC9E|nr:SGNH/GDSL hydrolase family protein [uncultured Bacteroides sp.]
MKLNGTENMKMPKVAFIGNSHMAYWPLDAYFPMWKCLNYGLPGEGLDYIRSFSEDVSDCYAVVQFGTNDLYRINSENMSAYADAYVKAVKAIRSKQTYLFCIFPRNDFMDSSTSVNRFIAKLNHAIRSRIEGTGIIYLDVFDKLLLDGRLNPDMTVDDLHLNGNGYRILADTLLQEING